MTTAYWVYAAVQFASSAAVVIVAMWLDWPWVVGFGLLFVLFAGVTIKDSADTSHLTSSQ